jgi:hypothetical protein
MPRVIGRGLKKLKDNYLAKKPVGNGPAYEPKEVMSFVSCGAVRLENFEYDIFKVTITIGDNIWKTIANLDTCFIIPELPKAFLRQDQKYMVASNSLSAPWSGRFIEGVWEGIVQASEAEKDGSSIRIAVVMDALVANVMNALACLKDMSCSSSGST